MTAECAHDDLEVAADVDQCNGPDGAWLDLKLRVRCDACGTQLHFRGLNSGIANPYEPVVSADAYELRAPIVPGPGAMVGLMKSAGLEDRLRELREMAIRGESPQ